MSRDWSKGSTAAWRKVRARVLLANQQENKGNCVLNIKGVCEGKANQVHHLKGKAFGDDQRHLVAVCRACNLHVGNPGKNAVDPKPRSIW